MHRKWAIFIAVFLFAVHLQVQAMHIVAITGSLRKASCNTGILRAMAKLLPAGHTMDVIVPELTLFNQDLERPDVYPQDVKDFRKRLKAADCFLFALPEYNFSMSGAVKNAIDWGSRGPDGGNLFNDKPAAVVSAGAGVGGMRAAQHFRDSSLYLNLHVMNQPNFSLQIFKQPSPFDLETGDLVDETELENSRKVLEALIAWTNRLTTK